MWLGLFLFVIFLGCLRRWRHDRRCSFRFWAAVGFCCSASGGGVMSRAVNHEVWAEGMRSKWGARNFQQTCQECGRVFDLLNESDANDLYGGHDCEGGES